MRISDWSSDVCSSDLRTPDSPDRLTQEPLKPDLLRLGVSRDHLGSVDELAEAERLRRRRPHEVIAMDIVDVDRHHVEAGQGPKPDLDAHEQRQPIVRAPYDKRHADVRQDRKSVE